MTKCSITLTAIVISILSIIYGGIAAHYVIEPLQAVSTTDSNNMGGGVGAISASAGMNSKNISSSTTTPQALASAGTTEQPANGESMAKTLVLTAVADKPTIKAGDTQTIHIRTAMDNGTGIPDVTIQALTQEYNATNQKVLLGGQTDNKGNLDLTVTTGPHAKPGQFLIVTNASKDDIKSSVASGFAVTETGKGSFSSSSSSSSSGSGKCSGSSCK